MSDPNSARNPPARVLLVEDQADHAELVERLFAMSDRAVECVWKKTLAEATTASLDGIDAILLDLVLPDSRAPNDTLATMLDAALGAPIIVLTSLQDASLGRDAVKRGAQDYLVKSSLTAELLVRTLDFAIERKRYAGEIERSNRELQHFAYVVAHELRSPLAVMIASLDLLMQRHGGELPAGVQEWLNGFRESSHELAAFLSDLLSFATVSGDFDIEPVDCGELVASMLRGLQPDIARARATVVVEPLPKILTARTMVSHIFQNLVSNAIKYRGQQAPRIRISSAQTADDWSFTVADNGLGMSPDEAARVFDMFARADRRRRSSGFGIGLAFCKQAVERLGGKIWLESEQGQGSRFSFSIPKAKPEYEQAAALAGVVPG